MKKVNKDKALFDCQHQTILKVVNGFFKDMSKSIDWMYTRNPLLGNIIPKEMLQAGRFDKLIKLIHIQLEDNKR